MLIDSHCHLDFDVLNDDLDGVLTRMAEAGVGGCVTISTRISQFDRISAIAEQHDNVWCSVGTHPHNAGDEDGIEADEIVSLAAHPKCVAIGEVGLDYYYDNAPRDAQQRGFRTHIAAARETGLPLVIHTRDAEEDTTEILRDEMKKGTFPFVLHCFSSSPELAQVGVELGGYVSFSGILTFKNATNVHQAAAQVPLDRLLVETDAPYLAPVPHRGKPNQPAYVAHTAARLAEMRELTLEKLADITTANFARLFSKTRIGA